MKDIHLPDLYMLKALYDGTENAVIYYTPGRKIKYCNAAAAAMYGYDTEDMYGMAMEELMPATCRAAQSALFARVLKGEKIVNLRSLRLTRQGTVIPVSLTAVPVAGDNGLVTGACYIARNITGEKKAEEKQGLLSAIIESSDDAIISKTMEGIITSWNPGAEKVFGYTESEAIGKHISLLIPPERLNEEAIILKTIRKGEIFEHFQTARLSKSGQQIAVSLTVSPVKDKEGHIIGISKIARNISLQKLAEEKQALLAAIVASSDDAIISKTLEGIITTWNKGAENIFGYTESEAIGKHISILIPANRMAEETTIIESIKRGVKVDHFETIRMHKDGTELAISLTVSPVKAGNGNIIGASKVARDITIQKNHEAHIRQHAGQLALLNSAGKTISEKLDMELIVQKVTDTTRQITGAAFSVFLYAVANKNGEEQWQAAFSGIPGSAFENFDIPERAAIFNNTLREKKVVRSADITGDSRYGRNTPFLGIPVSQVPVLSYMAVPVVSGSGLVIGGLFFGHPQQDRFTAAHEALVINLASQAAVALDNARLFEEVNKLSRKKDEFIALASHELKTPLTSMNGFLQILEQKTRDPGYRVYVKKILSQLKKLNTLINDLFDISKIQAGKLQFDLEQFDLGDFMATIIDNYRESFATHTILFETGGTYMVEADKIRLEQVITNLLSNAIKYSPKADKIAVHLEDTADEVFVYIKDYGFGIDQENIHKIFDQFYRTGGESSKISGLGLGLYISREIIERLHGRIWAESEPGKGSVFIFTLPLVKN